MRNLKYSSIDPITGNVSWNGPLSIEKGNHLNMPSRTEAYLPGFERGHVNASSLGGSNTRTNVVPQHADVNHQGYLSLENGERRALKSGASIESQKIAIVNSKPGDTPVEFVVNDSVLYPDGYVDIIHNSFINESYALQSEWYESSSAFPDTFYGQNPNDTLRDSMDINAYADLMEITDAELPTITEDYARSDYYGLPEIDVEDSIVEQAEYSAEMTAEAECDMDVI